MNNSRMKDRTEWDDHTFVVEGRGEFPFDMLRHSEAWPKDTESALAMAGDPTSDKRRVMLVGRNARWVSVERWGSFGWKVVAGFHNGYPTHIDEHYSVVMELETA